jgi:DNA-directed RNA polymerase specialized sigma24 family protein
VGSDGAYIRMRGIREGYRRIYDELSMNPVLYSFVWERMQKALGRLEPVEREVMEGLYVGGKTIQQLAGPRGLPDSAITTARNGALKKIKAMYELHI